MFETMLLLIAAPLAIAVVPHLFAYIREQRAISAMGAHDAAEGILLQACAAAAPVTASSLIAEGYGAEEINAFGRMLIIAKIERKLAEKAVKAARTAERVVALRVKDVVRTGQVLARSERSRQAWARKKAERSRQVQWAVAA